MFQMESESVNKGYSNLLNELINKGELVSPRGEETWEMQDFRWKITNPRMRSCEVIGRWKNLGFQLAECMWILVGRHDLETPKNYVSDYDRFSDDGETLSGAYGRRLRSWEGHLDQFVCVYEKFLKDFSSRQAVMIIFNPSEDYKHTRDVPCTNWLHFTIRDNKLNLKVQMRSNDAIWGTPYNLFNFMTIQEVMTGWLGIEMGYYIHQVSCMHVYKSKLDIIKRINSQIENSIDIYDYFPPKDARINRVEFEQMLITLSEAEKLSHIRNYECEKQAINCIRLLPKGYWQDYGWTLLISNIIMHKLEYRTFEYLDNVSNEFRISLLQRLARFLYRQDINPLNFKPFASRIGDLPEKIKLWICENPIKELEAISEI